MGTGAGAGFFVCAACAPRLSGLACLRSGAARAYSGGIARGPEPRGPLRSLPIQALRPSRCPLPGSSLLRQSLICSGI